MSLKHHLRRGAAVMARTMADEDPWSYHHVATDETIDVTAFIKFVQTEQDGYGAQTKRQRIPVVRALDLPWPDGELVGDTVTSPEGEFWYVVDAYTRSSGWTDLHVGDRM